MRSSTVSPSTSWPRTSAGPSLASPQRVVEVGIRQTPPRPRRRGRDVLDDRELHHQVIRALRPRCRALRPRSAHSSPARCRARIAAPRVPRAAGRHGHECLVVEDDVRRYARSLCPLRPPRAQVVEQRPVGRIEVAGSARPRRPVTTRGRARVAPTARSGPAASAGALPAAARPRRAPDRRDRATVVGARPWTRTCARRPR